MNETVCDVQIYKQTPRSAPMSYLQSERDLSLGLGFNQALLNKLKLEYFQ